MPFAEVRQIWRTNFPKDGYVPISTKFDKHLWETFLRTWLHLLSTFSAVTNLQTVQNKF